MKALYLTSCLLITHALLIVPTMAQGPLDPPAAPAPVYKTLTEVEPRTIISSLPYTISASGSYYLGASLTGTSGSTGITISSSNVTLDLNGFTLQGVAGSLDGISVTGSQNMIRLKNGHINGFEGDGIDLSSASQVSITELSIRSCSVKGIELSSADRVDITKVSVGNCTEDGISLGQNSSLKDSRVFGCTLSGVITSSTGSVISNNILENNTLHGINLANNDATVTNNECLNNTSHGILVSGTGNTVKENRTISNGIGYEVTGSSNSILRNYTKSNGDNQAFSALDNQYDVLISEIPELLNVPCNAKLTGNLINSTDAGDGITIDTDNVTLDLGGFSVIGSGHSPSVASPNSDGIGQYLSTGPASDDGIVVLGSQENITIRNGSIVAWGGDGVNALNADFSIFEDLHVSFNGSRGLIADFNCIIKNCTAHANGSDGLEGDDGTVIVQCTASENRFNGIQTSEGCTVTQCASFNNDEDGIDVGPGSTVTDSTCSDNLINGFDIALGGIVKNCNAYDNGSSSGDPDSSPITSGFDIASDSLVKDCRAANTNGHGFRSGANSYITGCKSHENDFDGIRISSTDCVVENNVVTDNDVSGIRVTSSGCLIIKNKAAGNLASQVFNGVTLGGDFDIGVNNSFGPIIVLPTGNIGAVTDADHPQANFSF